VKPAPSRISRRKLLAQLGVASALVVPAALGLGVAHVPSAYAADPAPAAVPQSAKVEVMVLHGTNATGKAGGIDPRVDEGKPQTPAENLPSHKLTKPPLSSYNTYVLKDRQKVQLTKGTPQHVALPNGRTLELSLVGVALVNVGQDRFEKRYTVAASISPPSGDRYSKLIEFTASVHQSMFVGGIAFPTGSLVVAFTVEP
jgi:hypothetical protein